MLYILVPEKAITSRGEQISSGSCEGSSKRLSRNFLSCLSQRLRTENTSANRCCHYGSTSQTMQLMLPSSSRYFMHSGKVDMRKGVDGLSGVIQQDFNQNALSGDVFIFLNQNRNRIKLLHWQGDGFAIYYKRLERGTFEIPQADPANKAITITHHQLQYILDGIVLSCIKKRKRYSHSLALAC